MPNWIIYAVGFMAQLLFSGRLLYQWLLSEKSKEVKTPSLFWLMSLLASFMLFIYGWLRDDFAIMLGQILTYFIYIRNLNLQGQWKKVPLLFRIFVLLFPIVALAYGYNNGAYDRLDLFHNEDIPRWLFVLGVVSQLVFTLRFVYQWIYSERRKESVLPAGFWLLSICGSLLILSYAIIRRDPVLIVGQSMGSVIYFRNLMLLKNEND